MVSILKTLETKSEVQVKESLLLQKDFQKFIEKVLNDLFDIATLKDNSIP